MSAINQLIASQAQRNAPTSPMQAMAGMQQLAAGQQRMDMNAQAMQNDQAAMAQAKKQEGMKFAANVGAQMRQAATPEEKAKIYATSRQIAQMNGHDVSAFPEQFSPEAEQLMEGMYQQVFQPEEMKKRFMESAANMPQSAIGKMLADRDRVAAAGGDTSMFDQALKQAQSPRMTLPTSSQRDFETYQRLKKSDPEAAREFGLQAGFVNKEGEQLSAHLQKRLSTATDNAVKHGNTSRRLNNLAGEFEGADLGGGLFGSKWPELLKKLSGAQDADTRLREQYNGLRASQAVANLPPGAASDIDVKLALSEFPDEHSNGKHIASWMRGAAKLEDVRREFEEFKADFISENGHERGMLQAWKKTHAIVEKGQYSIGQVIEYGGKKYRVTGGDLNDPDVELIE